MGDVTGFKKIERSVPKSAPVKNRLEHFNEFYKPTSEKHTKDQASRCMDCGIPFCHSACPLGNYIPDFNHAVYKSEWKKAYEILISTNNFPEFTGRICPAPCEGSCVLGINNNPVTIEYVEKTIIERAFQEGWVQPHRSIIRTGQRIAIVGSGPAGLAAADELAKKGHDVIVFEKNDRIGGLLRYGIPDFKLSKDVLDRRLDIMKRSGVEFRTNVNVGQDISFEQLRIEFEAVILCGGATVPRDLPIPGRHLKGIHLAMDFLEQNNRKVQGDHIPLNQQINVKNENIMVIGGGDTGSDCIGTSNRLGAQSVTQIELLSKPPVRRTEDNPWPKWPQILRTSSSHEEGCTRDWSILTKRFVSEDGIHLSGIEIVKVEWSKDQYGQYSMHELNDSLEVIECSKAFLAIGFLHGEQKRVIDEWALEFEKNGNIKTQNFETSIPNVFAAGDARRGQSLVVWAIQEGRECARHVAEKLTNKKSEENTTAVSYSI